MGGSQSRGSQCRVASVGLMGSQYLLQKELDYQILNLKC